MSKVTSGFGGRSYGGPIDARRFDATGTELDVVVDGAPSCVLRSDALALFLPETVASVVSLNRRTRRRLQLSNQMFSSFHQSIDQKLKIKFKKKKN